MTKLYIFLAGMIAGVLADILVWASVQQWIKRKDQKLREAERALVDKIKAKCND